MIALGLSVILSVVANSQSWGGKAVTFLATGGQFTANSSEITFDVPAGAVATDTIVHVLPNRMVPNSPYLLPSTVISIGRPGLNFASPVKMTLTYYPETLPTGTVATSLRIYRLVGRKWSLVGGVVDAGLHTVATNISTVGTYGIFATSAAIPAENKITFQFTGLTDSKIYRCDQFGALRETIKDSRISPYPTWLNPTENAQFTFLPQPNGGLDLYLFNTDNSDPKKLTSLGFSDSSGLSFTADSNTLALGAKVGTTWRIFKIAVTGKSTTQIAVGGSTGGPAISPNGANVAFADGNIIKIVTLANGTLVRQFTTTLTAIRSVTFNPSGTLLAFTAKSGANANAIFTVPVAGGAVVQRTSAHGDLEPIFSPDGAQILFTRSTSFAGGKPGIWRVTSTATAADGTVVVPTTTYVDCTYFWR